MARLEALLMCDYVVAGPDGKLQLQGIFDRIFAVSLPASHRSAFLYFRFSLDKPHKAPYTAVSVMVKRPNGITEKAGEFKVPIAEGAMVEGNVALRNFPLHEKASTISSFITTASKKSGVTGSGYNW